MTIDVLPTIARLVGAPLPERPIDGLDISPLLLGEAGARSPHEALLFYYGTELRAVRGGRYKLLLPHRSQTLDGPGGSGGIPGKYRRRTCRSRFTTSWRTSARRPTWPRRTPTSSHGCRRFAEKAREDLGDSLTNRTGRGLREPGRR